MLEPNINDVDTRQLSRLMSLDDDCASWEPDEFEAIFTHQMNVPLRQELAGCEPAAERIVQRFESITKRNATFYDLFTAAQPPLEIMALVKRYAKQLHAREDVPREISRVLYIAAVAGALVRCNERITRMDDEALIERIEWAGSQQGIPSVLAALYRQAVSQLQNDVENM